MPSPGGGGVQTSLVGRVQSMMATARSAMRRKPGAPVESPGDKNNPADLSQFADVFEPSGGLFAPGYPLPPVEPEKLRVLDYPVGYNYIYTPRSFEPIGFGATRRATSPSGLLNGAKPGDIPIYQATRFPFVINLEAAKARGLTIPPALLALADELIE